MKKDCEVIRDLIPLVIDEAASEGSRDAVSTHLAICPDCAAYMQQMESKLPVQNQDELIAEKKAFQTATVKLRRKKALRMIRVALIGVLITCVIIFAGLFGYDRLMKARVEIPLNSYEIILSQLQDGSVMVSADYEESREELRVSLLESQETDGKNVLYIGMTKGVVSRSRDHGMQNGRVSDLPQDQLEKLDEIRQGTPGEYVTLWKKADGIAAASEEMEQYAFWNSLWFEYSERMVSTDDGKAGFTSAEDWYRYRLIMDQMRAVESTVPEWQPWLGEEAIPLDENTVQWVTGENS